MLPCGGGGGGTIKRPDYGPRVLSSVSHKQGAQGQEYLGKRILEPESGEGNIGLNEEDTREWGPE